MNRTAAYAVANPTPSQTALAATKLKDRKAAREACQLIVTTAFSLFRWLLDGAAKEHRDNLDKEVHHDDSFTALNGSTMRGPRT